MLGTDTITIYKKLPDDSFSRIVVKGVQWADKDEIVNANGRVSIAKYASVTFFAGTFEGLGLLDFTEEDAIFYGVILDEVFDGKISTLLKKYPKSGIIKSVKDNSNRNFLRNIKVVLA